ncbi:MAG: hypothetical protein V4594_20025 [Bacteroidota bacterium]
MKKTENYKLRAKPVYGFTQNYQDGDPITISDPTLDTITVLTTGTRLNVSQGRAKRLKRP